MNSSNSSLRFSLSTLPRISYSWSVEFPPQTCVVPRVKGVESRTCFCSSERLRHSRAHSCKGLFASRMNCAYPLNRLGGGLMTGAQEKCRSASHTKHKIIVYALIGFLASFTFFFPFSGLGLNTAASFFFRLCNFPPGSKFAWGAFCLGANLSPSFFLLTFGDLAATSVLALRCAFAKDCTVLV